MKNIQTVLLAVIGIAVAVLYYLHFKSGNTNIDLNPSKETLSKLNGSKVVFINTDTFFNKYNTYKQLEKELEAQQKSSQQALQGEMKAMETEYMQLMQKAQSGQLTQQEGQAKEQDLIKRKQALEMESQSSMKVIAEKSQKANTELRKKLKEYFSENKSKYNCDYVLGYQTDGAIFYLDQKLDVTNMVLEDLNK